MSALNPSPLGSDDAADAQSSELRRYLPSPPAPLRTAAFWMAVMLPFLYVPLLASGVSTGGERGALASMLALNVAALYAGHGHDPE